MRRAYESPVWTMPMLTPIPFRPDEAHRRLYRSALGQLTSRGADQVLPWSFDSAL